MMTKPRNKKKNKAQKEQATRIRAQKAAVAAKEAAAAAKASKFFSPISLTTPTCNLLASLRKVPEKRAVLSPITTKGGSLVITQGNHQKQKIEEPPALNNTSTATAFEDAT